MLTDVGHGRILLVSNGGCAECIAVHGIHRARRRDVSKDPKDRDAAATFRRFSAFLQDLMDQRTEEQTRRLPSLKRIRVVLVPQVSR